MLKKSIIFTMASILLVGGGISVNAESVNIDIMRYSNFSAVLKKTQQ